jgi:hypothetical protein
LLITIIMTVLVGIVSAVGEVTNNHSL